MSGPDQRVFELDVKKGNFRLGEAEGRWRLIDIAWPHAFIAVTAKDGAEYILRFDCQGYPKTPPTGGPWDMELNATLNGNRWPRGKGGRLSAVFNPGWHGGTALYLPCDRVALHGHGHWLTQMPSKVWRPKDGIVQYLELVHELLNCSDYTPSMGSAA